MIIFSHCCPNRIIAATLGAGLSLPKLVFNYNKVVNKVKDISLTDAVRKNLEDMLPIRAHKIASGNIGISVTKWKDFASTVVTHFDSRSDLIDAVVAGCFIPLWSGKLMPPTYRGTKCFDGAWTDNVPKLEIDEYDRAKGVYQVIICPFNGDVDVCPDDEDQGLGLVSSFGIKIYFNFSNLCRSFMAVVPRNPDMVDNMIGQGHNDMKRYLLKDNLLKCKQCYESSSRLDSLNQNTADIPKEEISACLRCLLLKEKVSNLKVPKEILSKYQLEYQSQHTLTSIYNSPHRK